MCHLASSWRGSARWPGSKGMNDITFRSLALGVMMMGIAAAPAFVDGYPAIPLFSGSVPVKILAVYMAANGAQDVIKTQ